MLTSGSSSPERTERVALLLHAAVGSFIFVTIEQAIKNRACGGADEHLLGRLIAMISSTRVKFVLASVPS